MSFGRRSGRKSKDDPSSAIDAESASPAEVETEAPPPPPAEEEQAPPGMVRARALRTIFVGAWTQFAGDTFWIAEGDVAKLVGQGDVELVS